MRKIARKDKHHTATVNWLRNHGVEVIDLSAVGIVPDLLTIRKGEAAFVELKIPGSGAKWYAKQLAFIASTKARVAIAESPEDAMQALSQKRFISQKAKDMIGAMLAIRPKDVYTPAELQKVWDK